VWQNGVNKARPRQSLLWFVVCWLSARQACKENGLVRRCVILECCMSRVGQNRINTPYTTVYLVIFLPKLPYIHCIYKWFWPTLCMSHETRGPVVPSTLKKNQRQTGLQRMRPCTEHVVLCTFLTGPCSKTPCARQDQKPVISEKPQLLSPPYRSMLKDTLRQTGPKACH